ncbi:hypothetical protein H4I96_07496 [Botrytis cinerea]
MLGNWSQGGPQGPPQGPPHNYNNSYSGPPQNYNNSYNAPVPNKTPRLPICFTCGQEGHYVKDCPNQNQSGQAAMVAPQTTNVNGYGAPPQTKQWASVQSGQMGSKYAPYAVPGSAPMSQFTDPGHNSQFNGPMPSAPSPLYQQHSTPNPQQQGPHSRRILTNLLPMELTTTIHLNSNMDLKAIKLLSSPSVPATPFQSQNNGYNQGYNSRSSSVPHQSNGTPNHGQWVGSPPAASSPNGLQQQQGQMQSNPGYNREFRRSQSQQSQQTASARYKSGASQNPPMTSPELNKRGLYIPRSKNTTLTAPSNASPQPAEVPIPSRASSVASTPYGSPSSRDNISEWDGQPAVLKEESHRTDEEKQFNWDYKKIFQVAGQRHETVALAQPLANRFDMTPVPLIDKKSTISISRYARRENLKEYRQSVRKTPQWPYLQEDPTFQELKAGEDSVSFQDLDDFMQTRHGDAHVSITARKATAANIPRTAKRKPSPTEQDDIDEQLQADVSTLKTINVKRFCGDDALKNSPPLAEAPDDIWAPQAGESADPTEALLASLGVSGAPKPVEPGPPVMIPMEDLQQPIYSPQQPLYESHQTPYGSQNTQHNQQPTFNAQQQPPYTQQPPFNAQQPPYNSQQQPPYNHQPPFNAEQRPFNGQQQPSYNRQPSFNAQQPPYNPQQTPYNAQHPPYNHQPPFNTEQRPFNAQQPPFVAQQHSFNPQQPPYNAQQPYNAQRHPFNPNMAGQPFRQDPSYANARPSLSGPQGFIHQNIPPPPPPPVEEEPMFDPWPEHNVTTTPPPPDHTDNDKENGKKDSEGNAVPDSPLSPTSLEILAEIKKEPAKPRKIVRIISGKKGKESSRSSEEATPKLKRAPPVVDAAYG